MLASVSLLYFGAAKQPEVIETHAGVASQLHYYLRHGSNVADLQVNLIGKAERSLQSHEIAKQVRVRLAGVAL